MMLLHHNFPAKRHISVLPFPAPESTLDVDYVNNSACVLSSLSRAIDLMAATRTTTGTYFDASGNIQTAAINTPRLDVNLETGLSRGLLSEPTTSNLLLNSLIDKTPLATQTVSVTAQVYTLSFYGTGSIELSGAHSGTLTGVSDKKRVWVTFTPTAGNLVLTVTGSVFWSVLKTGYGPTSFIPTDGTAKSRGADIISLSGTNFSSWFSNTGTFILQYELNGHTRNSFAMSVSDGTTQNSYNFFAGNSGAGAGEYVQVITGNVSQANLPSGALSEEGKIVTIGLSISPTLVKAANALTSSRASVTSPTVNSLRFSNGVNAAQTNGWIRRVIFIPRELTTEDLIEVVR